MLKLTNELIKLYEKKVFFIANKYANNYNREDLISQGKLGLIKAAENYDETLGIKFQTFCELYVKGEILDYIRKDKNIKVTRDFIKLKKQIDLAKRRYIDINNKEPSIDELSYILGIEKEKIIEVLSVNQNVCSIDEKINSSEDIFLKDTISEEEKIPLIDKISLKDALNELSKEDRNLINERYYCGKTQTQIAKEMNISQVKVYRMERKILDELESKLAC